MVSRVGLAGSLGWVRLILFRFRDTVCPHSESSSPFIDLGSISNHLALSAEVTVAFGADANYQARERLVLAFVSFAFWFFGVLYSRFLYYSTFSLSMDYTADSATPGYGRAVVL